MQDHEKRIEALEKELAALKAKTATGNEAGIPLNRRPLGPSRDYTEGMGMPPATLRAMAGVVPDINRGAFDAAAHARSKGPGEPGGFGPQREPPRNVEPVKRGSGWIEPAKFPDRTKQFERFDDMVGNLIGGPNDTSRLK